ncbi:lysostaphin resistance A-like protein [Gluconacetobacter sacchari]|uniref:CPBP family intramembrane metalloprotease n=2 Tax=Gluconacetobacter sacchari TaxID=92759 RepID=A0A7W4IBW1_9PROT|nr:CPBP family intramembrane glutamic endopeptidase [Gluconacetobacter sacchari]MBB2160021.1 CPBP family intramembrane metalloprotease [Gluconacetobacter sacchari]GBQ27317.1 hypothetical protein AA12717_2642 [Gluconacetobacter sacchari DSM 12717]
MSVSLRKAASSLVSVTLFFVLSLLAFRYVRLPDLARLNPVPRADPASHTVARLATLCVNEIFLLFLICVITALFAAFERRDAAFCGFPLDRPAFLRVVQGAGLSLAGAMVLAAIEIVFGGLRFTGWLWSGPTTVTIVLLSASALTAVGLTEELWFRGYPLRRLETGLGWWPAAFLTSLVFATSHLSNPGEHIVQIVLLFLSGLVLCGVRRVTGSLWLGVGAHSVADFSDIVLGSPDPYAGNSPFQIVHLRVDGPAWLTGGENGVMFSIPGIGTQYLMMLVVLLLFRASTPRPS